MLYYDNINVFIKCGTNLYLRKLMQKELNRQQNCILNFPTCNHDCGVCPYYGEDWSLMLDLINRNQFPVDWAIAFKELLAMTLCCTTSIKGGYCNGQCMKAKPCPNQKATLKEA